MKKNICVFTCITGNYDLLKDPEIIEENIDYYCFTNNRTIKSSVWNIIYINNGTLSDTVLARKIKILGHDAINGKYDIYVWMDSSFRIIDSVNNFINQYCDLSQHDYFTFKHHVRHNIGEEMQACLFFGKETLEKVNKLKQLYNSEKYDYDKDNKLCETGIIIRKYSENVRKTMALWYEIVLNYSGRDQLSFNYAANVTGLDFTRIELSLYNNEYFKIYNHNNKKNKYSIYFKQNENDGIYEYKDGDKIYKKVNVVSNKLKIDIIVPKRCNYIDIDVSAFSKYVILDTQIDYKNNIGYQYINVYQYDNNVVSKNDESILRLACNFETNDKIVIYIKLLDDQILFFNNYINELKNNYTNQLKQKDEDYKKINDKYRYINNLYNQIINSKRWKIMNAALKKIKK